MDPNNLDINSLNEEQLQQIVNSRQPQQAEPTASPSEPAIPQQMPAGGPSPLSELSEAQLQAIVNSRPHTDNADQKNWFDSSISVLGAAEAGIMNIPRAMKFDIQQLMNTLGEFVGIIPKGEADIRNKDLKAALEQSTKDATAFGFPLKEDVEAHPNVARGARATGAFLGELAATGPLGAGIGAASKIGRAAVQGGVLSGLQAERDHGAAIAEGAVLGGAIQGAVSGIGAIARGLSAPERAAETGIDKVNQVLKQNNLNIDDILENGYSGKSNIRKDFAEALKNNQDKSNALYDNFRAAYGDTPATPGNFSQFVQSNAVPSKQGVMINPKGDYAALEPNNIVNKRLQQFTQNPPQTIEELMAAKNMISKDISSVGKLDPNRAQIKDLLGQMRNSFESDMAVAAGQRGDDALAKYNAAKQFYKDNIVPFSDAQISKGLNNAGVDSTQLSNKITKLMADTSPQRQQLARDLLKAAGPEAQTSLKMNIAGDVAAKSVKDGLIDTAEFAKNYDQAVKKYGMAFSKEDRQIAQALNNIAGQLNATKTVFDPLAGSTAAAAGAVVGGAPGAGTAYGTFQVLKFLANTDYGRKTILAIGKMAENDPKLPAAVKSIQKLGSIMQPATPPAIAGALNRQPNQGQPQQ